MKLTVNQNILISALKAHPDNRLIPFVDVATKRRRFALQRFGSKGTIAYEYPDNRTVESLLDREVLDYIDGGDTIGIKEEATPDD